MEAFLVSMFTVAIAEIGDKTQLLALVLACRYHRPWMIVCGVALSTLLNRVLAGFIGQLMQGWLNPGMLSWIVGLSFLLVAGWALIPEKLHGSGSSFHRYGPFLATFMTCFLAEMGDKTQLATVMLAARYDSLLLVVIGSTLGALVATVPVIFAGRKLTMKISMKTIRFGAAGLFGVLGVLTIF